MRAVRSKILAPCRSRVETALILFSCTSQKSSLVHSKKLFFLSRNPQGQQENSNINYVRLTCLIFSNQIEQHPASLGASFLPKLQLQSGFDCPAKSDLIRKFEVSANRQAACQTRHLYAQGLDKARKITGRCFAFNVWVRCQDDFLD